MSDTMNPPKFETGKALGGVRKALAAFAIAVMAATGLSLVSAVPAEAAITTLVQTRTCNVVAGEDYVMQVEYTRDSSNGVVDPKRLRIWWSQFPSSIIDIRGTFTLDPSNGPASTVSIKDNSWVSVNYPASGSYTGTGTSDSPFADCSVSFSFT